MRNSRLLVQWRSICVMTAVLGICSATRAGTFSYTAIDLYTMTPPPGIINVTSGFRHPSGAGTVVGYGTGNNKYQGLLWAANGQVTNLMPTNLSGFSTSFVEAISSNQQAGYGGGTATGLTSTNTNYHALLWNGTANSAVDLQPTNLTGFVYSYAYGTDGTHQVGLAATADNTYHAMVWSGSAASAVDLNPTQFPGYYASVAYGVDGTQQVGLMSGDPFSVVTPTHAMLWNGSAASAIDLHPTNPLLPTFDAGSEALGIGGGQEVGFGQTYSHEIDALLWTGTAASAVDLGPAGFTYSEALATNGSQQVGYDGVGDFSETNPSAVVWSGTADSAVNLQKLLPLNLVASTAYYIDPSGNVFGTAEDTSGNLYAIEWAVNLPEPASALLMLSGLIFTASMRWPKRQTAGNQSGRNWRRE